VTEFALPLKMKWSGKDNIATEAFFYHKSRFKQAWGLVVCPMYCPLWFDYGIRSMGVWKFFLGVGQ